MKKNLFLTLAISTLLFSGHVKAGHEQKFIEETPAAQNASEFDEYFLKMGESAKNATITNRLYYIEKDILTKDQIDGLIKKEFFYSHSSLPKLIIKKEKILNIINDFQIHYLHCMGMLGIGHEATSTPRGKFVTDCLAQAKKFRVLFK